MNEKKAAIRLDYIKKANKSAEKTRAVFTQMQAADKPFTTAIDTFLVKNSGKITDNTKNYFIKMKENEENYTNLTSNILELLNRLDKLSQTVEADYRRIFQEYSDFAANPDLEVKDVNRYIKKMENPIGELWAEMIGLSNTLKNINSGFNVDIQYLDLEQNKKTDDYTKLLSDFKEFHSEINRSYKECQGFMSAQSRNMDTIEKAWKKEIEAVREKKFGA